jgi:hypothetical protein
MPNPIKFIVGLKWARPNSSSMTTEVTDSEWAFDCRFGDGGRWHEDLPNEEMKKKYPSGKMVHIGIREEWPQHETSIPGSRRGKHGSWSKPLVAGAEKAKWGGATFAERRYLCCEDEENCGIPVSVAQGSVQKWNFRRQPPTSGTRKPSICINHGKWSGESMYHNLTKRQVARTLDLTAWKEEFGIQSVHLEKELVFERESESVKIQPDVHVVLNDGTILYIEVVYKNPPKKLHHDVYGEGLAIIDLRDEANRVVLSASDEDERIKSYRAWVRNGGVEKALREELNLEHRQALFKKRQENFERNNITVVREYLAEIKGEKASKWYRLSEESIQTLEDKIEEGMSKEKVRQLYLEALERQDLDDQIEDEIWGIEEYDTDDLKPSQFNSVEEVLPFVKQKFTEKMDKEQEKQIAHHGFKIDLDVNPKWRFNDYKGYNQVGSPEQVRKAYQTEAPMRRKEFKKQEEYGFKLDIKFSEYKSVNREEISVQGVRFIAGTAGHVTTIYKFAAPIIAEENKCKAEFEFDAELEYLFRRHSGLIPHYIVHRAEDVRPAYLKEKEIRDNVKSRSENWTEIEARMEKDCTVALRPLIKEIKEFIFEESKADKVGDKKTHEMYLKKLNRLLEYRFWVGELQSKHILTRHPGESFGLENYCFHLDNTCPHIWDREHHDCFNLDFLGLEELKVQLMDERGKTLKGTRYSDSEAAKVVDILNGKLPARLSYFQKCVAILSRRGKDESEAQKMVERLTAWYQSTRADKIDYCLVRGVRSEEGLLSSRDISEAFTDIRGLELPQMLYAYWAINPLDQTKFAGGADPLYREWRGKL